MSVTLRGHTFYTASEVSAMTPSGTMDSQWETYDLAITNGCTLGWDANRFFVNKITGLVVGWIGLQEMSNMTSLTYGTNANLAPHSGLRLAYTGQFEYGTNTASATEAINYGRKEMNTTINSAGAFTLQGVPTSLANKAMYDTHIEHFAYPGAKYSKITTTDIKQPVYLKEGAFYDANTADLICGKAWLRFDVTAPSGYSSASYVSWFKNLWSGEIVMQYSLYPTTAGTCPAITIPSRCAVVDGRNFYTDVRYTTGRTSAVQRQNTWMRLNNTTLSFYAPQADWLTGTLYYPGNSEVRPQNASQKSYSLWVPESSSPITSADNSTWPSTAASGTKDITASQSYLNTTYYKARSGIDSWTWRSRRTGMVFNHWDLNSVTTSLPSPITSTKWSADFLPSYRYNKSTSTYQVVYYTGAGYLGTRADTAASVATEYTCNIAAYCGTSLGVMPTGTSYDQLHFWGSPGNWSPVANNLTCFTGQYLGNSAGNIVK